MRRGTWVSLPACKPGSIEVLSWRIVVTEDYSEYESVDEEEPEEEAPKKKATKTKARKSTTPAEEHKALKASDTLKDDSLRKSKGSSSHEKPKRSNSSAGSKSTKGSLNSFFGKK